MRFNFDMSSDAYLRFVSFAWDAIVERIEPMEEGEFWGLIAKIDWPSRCHNGVRQLSREHAARVSLQDAARCYLAAIDVKDDLESLFEDCEDEDIWEIIPSEDGMEDFLYHLVGQGRRFFQRLKNDISAGLRIAEEGSYVESLRYVLEGARDFYPVEDYIALCSADGALPELSHPPQAVGSMVLVSELPAIIVRHDNQSVHVVTPVGVRDFPHPGAGEA